MHSVHALKSTYMIYSQGGERVGLCPLAKRRESRGGTSTGAMEGSFSLKQGVTDKGSTCAGEEIIAVVAYGRLSRI